MNVKTWRLITVLGVLLIVGGAPLTVTQSVQYFKSQETHQWVLASVGVNCIVVGFLLSLLTLLYALKSEDEINYKRFRDELPRS